MRDRGLWTAHIAAGIVILPLLVSHMAVMHLDATLGVASPAGGHPVEWANVVERGKTLLFPLSYGLLLLVALFHGLYGARNVLLELGPSRGMARAIGIGLALVGVGLGALGLWAAFASHRVAAAATVGG